MEPITGPILDNTSTGDLAEIGAGLVSRRKYRQAKPYDLPLPYRSRHSACLSGGGKDTTAHIAMYNWWSQTTLDIQASGVWEVPDPGKQDWEELDRRMSLVLNKARDKFFDKANSRVSLSVDILQRRQAFEMMTKRVTQAGRVFLAIKKGRFREALAELGIRKPAGWQPAVRNAGGLWLEYSYGWKPLVKDIFEASQVLSNPGKDLWIQESASNRWISDFVRSNVGYPYDHNVIDTNSVNLKIFARVGAVVSCDNPNLQALKNAGLTNPTSWAWELIPFSFVVDWFYGVGDFIESLDDTLGLSIKSGFYTTGFKGTSRISRVLVEAYPLGVPDPYNGSVAWKSRSVARMDRVLGLPTVKLVRKLKILTNLDRGLNAASLLAQALRR